ncbi:hypothetical protein [Vibrio azureus]|uniref:Uncharacterized protein n=2 Tax=Vibrio azureus TaxID=512649 RepID=U3CIG0_9VIBR|nr:hypothetical protein [Vibrio azureus]GAD78033.1 hypothetical protein VAZ01S_113_00080 [Vibrio azureus NBRC 104587]
MDSGTVNEQMEPLADNVEEVSMVKRLKAAYIKEREQLELIEVELNRSKVVIIDESGQMTRVSILSEH